MRHRVLFVDDDPNLLDGLQRALRRQPFDFLRAGSGEEGLELLGRETVSVVVSDNNMPGMDGTEFLRRVREAHPDTIRFLMTGQATADAAIAAINVAGVSRFFTKPCDPTDVAVAILAAIENRELLMVTRRLMTALKAQGRLLEELEAQNPGITDVQRGPAGEVIVDGLDSVEDALREAAAYFE